MSFELERVFFNIKYIIIDERAKLKLITIEKLKYYKS